MNLLRKLIPDFLRQWDLYLLQNAPRSWSTRIHLHLWFLFLVNLLVLVLGLIIPVDLLRFPDPDDLFGYMMVPTVVYFAFWTYKVVLFSVEKRFGERSPWAEVGELLLLIASVALIWSIPFNLGSMITWRAANTVDDGTFAGHIDHLNLNAHAFIFPTDYPYYDEHSYYSYRPSPGTHAYFRSLEEYRTRAERPDTGSLHNLYESYLAQYNSLKHDAGTDPSDLATYKEAYLSIERTYPYYYIAHGFFTPYDLPVKVLNDSLLEQRYIQHMASGAEADEMAIAEALRIAGSYSDRVDRMPPREVLQQFRERKISTTGLQTATRQMYRIATAKSGNYFFFKWEFLVMLAIVSFSLALAISIFKSIYWQPFLIAVVTSAITPIIIMVIGLIIARDLLGVNDEDLIVSAHYLVLLAMIIAVPFVMRLRAYRTILAVATILGNLAIPFMGLFTLFLLHEYFDIFGLDALETMVYSINWEQLPEDLQVTHNSELTILRKKVELWLWSSLVAGILIYILMLHPLFKRVFGRLVALPEPK